MVSYTNDSFDKLPKQDLILIALSLQSQLDEANNKVLDEVRNLWDAITKLSSDLSITKNVNTLLSNKLATLERRFWENAQYSRRECVGIKGIPCKVSGKVVEEKILNIFDKIGCSIFSDHIESGHHISQKVDIVIVKFSWQMNYQQVC